MDHGGNEDDENHGNEKPTFKENNHWRGLKGRCFPGILGVKFSLKNLRHSRDNTLLLAVNKVKEPGSILTSGDSEGLGRGNLPRVWEGLQILKNMTPWARTVSLSNPLRQFVGACKEIPQRVSGENS